MVRWIALALTILCMFSCSFTSTSVIRGVLAPFGVAILSFVTLFLFVRERVAEVARPSQAALLDAETLALMRKKAAAQGNQDTASGGDKGVA